MTRDKHFTHCLERLGVDHAEWHRSPEKEGGNLSLVNEYECILDTHRVLVHI